MRFVRFFTSRWSRGWGPINPFTNTLSWRVKTVLTRTKADFPPKQWALGVEWSKALVSFWEAFSSEPVLWVLAWNCASSWKVIETREVFEKSGEKCRRLDFVFSFLCLFFYYYYLWMCSIFVSDRFFWLCFFDFRFCEEMALFWRSVVCLTTISSCLAIFIGGEQDVGSPLRVAQCRATCLERVSKLLPYLYVQTFIVSSSPGNLNWEATWIKRENDFSLKLTIRWYTCCFKMIQQMR